jgi:MFS family permease
VGGAFLTYGSIFFDRLAPLYLVALIARDLGVPSAAQGTLALLIGVGWAVAMPIVRAASGRFDDRTRIAVGVVGTAMFGLASAAAPTWVWFVVLRGLGGIFAGSGSPVFTSLVYSIAPPRRRGLDLGLVQSSTRVIGSMAAPVVVTAVAVAHGWREAMVVSSLVLLATLAVFFVAVPASRRRPGSHVSREPFAWHPGGRRNMVLCTLGCVILIAWLMIWSQSSVTLVADWLVVCADEAGRRVGLFGIGAGLAAMLLPIASDGIGRRAAMAVGALLGGGSSLAVGVMAGVDVVPPGWVVGAAILLAGVAMGILPFTISLVPAESVATGDRARALVIPISAGEILGGALLPVVAAVLAVPFGHAAVVGACGAALLGLLVVSLLLRPVGDQAPVGGAGHGGSDHRRSLP